MTDKDNADSSKNISAYNIKLPPFWTAQPDIWFHQAEAQFSLGKISSDRTKYDYVLASLPSDIISHIFDIIHSPPSTDLYQNLKNKIIQRLSASEEQRLEVLLSGIEMGDRKPSEFYREMTSLSGGSSMVSPELLTKLWKRRLPKTISVAITTSGKTSTDDILDIADKIWESYKDINISTVGRKQSTFSTPASTSTFEENISHSNTTIILKSISDLSDKFSKKLDLFSEKQSQLEEKFNLLQTQINTGNTGRYKNENYNLESTCKKCRSRSGSRGRNSSSVCFYHEKFKEKATKCGGKWCLLNFLLRNDNLKN